MSKILVVDDDAHIQRTLEIMLQDDGHDVKCAASAEEAVEALDGQHFDTALVDLLLPGMSGMDLLRHMRDQQRDVDVIIITAHGSIETAVEAMKKGAFDYVTKPFSPDQVRHRLAQLRRVERLRQEVSGLRQRLGEEHQGARFITDNRATRRVLDLARTVAETDATVLIAGESGTGKGLLGRLIHGWSARAGGTFAVGDCASFHESLLESELFGHRKGAFTGAVADRAGKAEAAHGGTLFLDEVGELPQELQAKLLRLVEDKVYERLGDPTPRTMDARIIAATNRDLPEMVGEKLFRQDLFFRLSVVELTLPALRSRHEDIPLLARHFLDQANATYSRKVEKMDEEVEALLQDYPWPGNVRELAHVVERAVLVCPGRVIRLAHLPPRILEGRDAESTDRPLDPLTAVEERHLRRALSLGLSLDEVARKLGIDPSTLWRKRKKYGL